METADRVRANTQERINRRIDREIEECVREYAQKSPEEIALRIGELDREWDIERVLEANASVLAFTGLLLGVTQNKRWLWLPGLVLPFLFQHAVQAGVRRFRCCAAWACAPGRRSTGRNTP